MSENAAAERHPGRLLAWLGFVLGLTALNYLGRFAGDGETPDDVAYQWESSIAVVVQFGLMLGALLLITIGLPKRRLFGLRRPRSWPRALGLVVAALVLIYLGSLAYTGILSLLGDYDPTEEQGLVPDGWDSSRVAPFVAFFLAVTLLAPVVEELTYRGLGFAAVRDAFGAVAAVVVTAIAFGLAHGLIVALPVLTIFGLILGVLRLKTESLYPPILLHGFFNGIALIAAVTV